MYCPKTLEQTLIMYKKSEGQGHSEHNNMLSTILVNLVGQ